MSNCVRKILIQNWNPLLLRMLPGLKSILPEFISNFANFGLFQFYPLVISTLIWKILYHLSWLFIMLATEFYINLTLIFWASL